MNSTEKEKPFEEVLREAASIQVRAERMKRFWVEREIRNYVEEKCPFFRLSPEAKDLILREKEKLQAPAPKKKENWLSGIFPLVAPTCIVMTAFVLILWAESLFSR